MLLNMQSKFGTISCGDTNGGDSVTCFVEGRPCFRVGDDSLGHDP